MPPRGWSWAGLSMRILFTLAGAAGLIISAFLNWIENVDGVNLEVESLWRPGVFNRPQSGEFWETVGFAMLVLGLLAIIGLAPRSGWLTRLAGALGLVGFVLFVIQVYRTREPFDISDLQLGAWLALAGSVVALIGGFLGTRARYVMPPAPAVIQEP
ncbi:MAG: sugar:proton symporter [Actinomycetota bacterium]|nr:sugar:proton symporter [Actinomycetota bacterium]